MFQLHMLCKDENVLKWIGITHGVNHSLAKYIWNLMIPIQEIN